MTRALSVAAQLGLIFATIAAGTARAQAPEDEADEAPPGAGPPPSTPAPPQAAPVAAAPVAPERPLRLFASTGYDHGLDDLLEVQFDDGSDRTLTVNGGFTFAVGAAFLPLQGGRFETRATIGVKYDSIRASNGSVRYLAFPLEVMEAWNVRRLRLSLGASLLLAPSVEGEDFLAMDLELKNSLGLVGQVEWVFPFRTGRGSLSAGLRYTWQDLEPEQGGAVFDANAIGGVFGVTL